ncbi:MAG: hypothetical protein Q7K21_06800 [Elusimicrobiota bacterium]|nr:hypothetical protein [Elusimicrobiota bacterium]
MDEKNLNFIRKFYGDSKIHELIIEQSKNYDYCIGAGQVLLERGWTLPVKEVEISKIEELMDDGLDLFFPIRCRDDKFFYIIWDIEYFNKKNPQFIFNRKNQRQIFEWISPALEIVEEILNSYGIKYVIDVTMSGVHVWSKISTSSEAFRKLSSEGFILASLEKKYSTIISGDRKRISPISSDLGRAYNCAGKMLEFFTHSLIRKNRKSNRYKIPVTISDAPQHGVQHPFSGISSDLTQYAHPIYMRCIRAICSVHQKTLINGHFKLGPAIDIVKTKGMTYPDATDIMWDVDKSIKHFRKNFSKKKLEITESSEGWLKAVNTYIKSDLRKKHKQWEKTVVPSEIPIFDSPDIKKLFDNASANPALLIPNNLQSIAEYFTKHGGVTAVKKMFSVIAEYYNNSNLRWYDHARFTGIDWNKYDAQTAADFWGRVYWSLNVSGLGREK